MPLALYAVYRVVVATVSTLTLLARPRLVRQLPWPYFRRLVMTNRRTTLAVCCLAVSTALFVVGVVEPSILIFSIVVGLISIVTSSYWGRSELKRG